MITVRSEIRPPAPSACRTCPYRGDVPSGVWAEEEYAKLERYDRPTSEQPAALWLCHQTDSDSDKRRMCAGWIGCHGGANLLALRIALIEGLISDATFREAVGYESAVPLFGSGAEAATHGRVDIESPGADARRAIEKIVKVRTGIRFG
ncbi:DUF6283 family protein [Kitasatospora sp. NPDC085464]|uniref:DUF6283 family protein n=1 Tax=Kitasatospora sp. NPDC085464 TaxID=3364063 RepID=UPI0037C7749F